MSGELSIRGLETLASLARPRSFRACADELHTTRPAIAARVAAREQALGVRLLERDRRGVTPTPEGAEAPAYADAVLDRVGARRGRFATPSRLVGRVRIGVIDAVARTWLPDLLALQEPQMIWLAERGAGGAAVPLAAVRQQIDDGRLRPLKTAAPLPPIEVFVSTPTRPASVTVGETARLLRRAGRRGEP